MEKTTHNEVRDSNFDSSKERLKELAAINQTVNILKEGKPIHESLQKICNILPRAWQYSSFCSARIVLDDQQWTSCEDYELSRWNQKQTFETNLGQLGRLEICYNKAFPDFDEGPFLLEERNLINNLCKIIQGHLNSKESEQRQLTQIIPEEDRQTNSSYHLLNRFLTQLNSERDVYHDLMPFKVKEILLIANLYDAFNLEQEGSFSNDIFSNYQHQDLSLMPRITGVSGLDEALEELLTKHFDLIVVMPGVFLEQAFEISEKVREKYAYIPNYLLLNHSHEVGLLTPPLLAKQSFDKVFVWNGDSKVFFAMVNYCEDSYNVENDTKVGLVNVVLLVGNDVNDYSNTLPSLYDNLHNQTRLLMNAGPEDERFKVFRSRTRPKVLLAASYEEAMALYKQYEPYIMCLIADVNLEPGNPENTSGFDLVGSVREENKVLPIVLTSREHHHQQQSFELGALFMDKNAESVAQDINAFVNHQMNLGNLNQKLAKERKPAIQNPAADIASFIRQLKDMQLLTHGSRKHFSSWLREKGEFELSKKIRGVEMMDHSSIQDYRKSLLFVLNEGKTKKQKGKLVAFTQSALYDASNIVSLSPGLLGGKGRGLAFVISMLNNIDFTQLVKDIHIKIPKTSIVGSNEFELFVSRNNIDTQALSQLSDTEIRGIFLKGRLSDKLKKRLFSLVQSITKPLAFRSSGSLEDSINQPFAGIFDTYLLPNNHEDINTRHLQACDAVKMVFASVFTKIARGYFEAVDSELMDEKMSVIIQEVVGNQYDKYFYPHISGVSQSYNYYPVSHMKPEDGFSVIALGLGKYVVEGERTFRFSHRNPEIVATSLKDQFNQSQTYFYAIDLTNKDLNLLEGEDAGLVTLDISDSEKHQTLKHLASTYDFNNDTITAGIHKAGPRVVNFANILKHSYIPLAETLEKVLGIVEEALGCPSEIEYAVDLNKDSSGMATFYLLQIKPLMGNVHDMQIDFDVIQKDQMLLYAERGMGHGCIDGLTDVIFLDPERFDKTETEQMAREVEELNQMMREHKKKYILVGPGRWGTRDKWIGIPVNWPQISNAKVVVEYSLPDFPLDASLGSHFFHNVTANNVGYFSVGNEAESFIRWDLLAQQKVIRQKSFFTHVEFDKPVSVEIDGKQRIAVIHTQQD